MQELIKQIQQGHNELMADLWARVKKLIAWYAVRYYRKYDCRGIEVDDLIQSGYIALVNAVRKYDPEQGSFTNYLTYDLLNQFQELTGRTKKQRSDLLNHALSLDAPLDESDPDGRTLYDSVADEFSDNSNFAEAVDDRIYTEQLRKALDAALDDLPEPEAEAIRGVYYKGETLMELAEQNDISYQAIKTRHDKGLRDIRKSSHIRNLQRFLDLETNFYKSISVYRFSSTHTSATEWLVLDRDRRLKEMIQLQKTDPERYLAEWDNMLQEWKQQRNNHDDNCKR